MPRTLTRVTGGALSPAPSPDGKSLFFLELTAKGVDLRRLPLPAKSLAASESDRPGVGFPILPPAPAPESSPLRLSPVGSPRPYNALQTQVLRLASGFTVGPDGNSFQLGVGGSDVVGQLRWTALAAAETRRDHAEARSQARGSGFRRSCACRSSPRWRSRGASTSCRAPSWTRRGSEASPRPPGEGRSSGAACGWKGAVGGRASRVEDHQPDFDRALGSLVARANFRRTRGESGIALGLELAGSFGTTAGSSWNQEIAAARLSGITSAATLAFRASAGDTGGSPTRFDLFALGGAPSAILPPGLDRNRIDSPALPAAVQLGERFEAYRAELSPSGFPLLLYAERMRAWNGGAEKPDWIRLEGIELRLQRISRRTRRSAVAVRRCRKSAQPRASVRLDPRLRRADLRP